MDRGIMEDLESVSIEELEAAGGILDSLASGDHYKRQEEACRAMGFTCRYIGQ